MKRQNENEQIQNELNRNTVENSRSEAASSARRTPSPRPSRKSTDGPILDAGEWLRAMTGFDAPFGHDGMPTVWS
jgi:hypothetical protein